MFSIEPMLAYVKQYLNSFTHFIFHDKLCVLSFIDNVPTLALECFVVIFCDIRPQIANKSNVSCLLSWLLNGIVSLVCMNE